MQDHLSKRLADDVGGDIQQNYSPAVVVLSSFGVFRGHDGIRASAAKLSRSIKGATISYKHTIIEGKYAFLEWTAKSDDKVIRDGADSFVVEDGRIVLQTVHYTVSEK